MTVPPGVGGNRVPWGGGGVAIAVMLEFGSLAVKLHLHSNKTSRKCTATARVIFQCSRDIYPTNNALLLSIAPSMSIPVPIPMLVPMPVSSCPCSCVRLCPCFCSYLCPCPYPCPGFNAGAHALFHTYASGSHAYAHAFGHRFCTATPRVLSALWMASTAVKPCSSCLPWASPSASSSV